MKENENIFEEMNAESIVDEIATNDSESDVIENLDTEINNDADRNEFVEKMITLIISASLAAVIAFIVKNWKKIKKWHLEGVIKREIKQRDKAAEKTENAQKKLNSLLEKMNEEESEEIGMTISES